MPRYILALTLLAVLCCLPAVAQFSVPSMPSVPSVPSMPQVPSVDDEIGKLLGKAGVVNKAYLQAIWDGWATADLERQGAFYEQGNGHLFFDIAPLKYNGWSDYKAGVAPVLKQFSSMKFTLNDDVQIHTAGNTITWVDGTVNMDATNSEGQPAKMTLRWTAVFEKQGNKWLITHEHVSVPMQENK